MEITTTQLQAIMPHASSKNIEVYTPLINRFAKEFQCDTPLRLAHILANIAHESGELSRTTENLNYSAERLLQVFPKYFNSNLASKYARDQYKIANRVYANRMGNGSELSGEGYKFRGRGLIQLTGRSMYALYSRYCGVDLLLHPELISEPFGATRSAFWFFAKYAQLLTLADQDEAKRIRKAINGGYNGLPEVFRYVNIAKSVLIPKS